MFLGHFNGEPVLVVRKGTAVHAMGAKCTHYGGPSGRSLFDWIDRSLSWHHACFRPETGEAVPAPAIDPVPCYRVERRGEPTVCDRDDITSLLLPALPLVPSSVVIVGGWGGGICRRGDVQARGYQQPVTIISADEDVRMTARTFRRITWPAPPGRMDPAQAPGLVPEDQSRSAHGPAVWSGLLPDQRSVEFDDGRRLDYGALLLATGASPIRLDVPGAQLSHVHYLRSFERQPHDHRARDAGRDAR
jgi:nitrite reductase/ring-hydroxylating ferredoxin subunit